MSHRTAASRVAALLAATLALSASGVPAFAKQKPFPDGQPPAPAPAADAKDAKAASGSSSGDWSKVTKDATKKEGFFTTWTKKENFYWEVKPNQLKKPFLLNAHFSKGIGTAFQLGGLPIADGMVHFERQGERLFLVLPNVRITATGPDSAYRYAVENSFGGSVVQSFKIEAEKDSTMLVDMTPFFVSDGLDLSTRLRAGTTKTFRFDKERSAVTSHKTFPKNIEVEALLTYSPNDRENLSLLSVPDNRFVPVSIHYSFLQLPEEPYVPRFADERVGYFIDTWKDMSHDYKDDFWVRAINRWKLEKKDPTAAVSEVKEPIVFYLDRTIPAEWRPYVRAGVEEWQKCFEAAGLKNAIIAKDEPMNDPDWDAEDARYSTIRWITSNEPSFGAIGPSQTDPRTGQILQADILIEGSMITGYSNQWRRFLDQNTISEALGALPADVVRMGLDPKYLCMAGVGHAEGGAFLATSMMLDGLTPPGQPVPKEYVGQGLKSVTMHEVGHTLGLRHNFKSSVATPMDQLHSKEYVSKHGLTGSIMDYDTPNVSSDPSRQGWYFSPTLGPYDYWVIRYGYTPTSATTSEDDYKLVEAIAREASQPGHEYGTDEDTYPSEATDPRCNIYDLGADPLGFAKERTNYVSKLWRSPNLEDRLMKDGDSYVTLRRALDGLLIQYTRGLSHARKYVGGNWASRAHKGDPGAAASFVPVTPDVQRDALAFVAERAFSPKAFDIPSPLLEKIGRDQYFDWGSNLFNYGQQEYPFLSRVELIQTGMMNGLMAPALLSRIREQEHRSPKPLKLADVFDQLTSSIMTELAPRGGAQQLAALDTPMPRRELQRAYVDRLSEIVNSSPAGMPEDAEALARLQLTRIGEASQRGLAAAAPKSETVRAHLMELRARTKRALEAQRSLGGARPAAGVATPQAAPTTAVTPAWNQ
jgi:hypothetical protein